MPIPTSTTVDRKAVSTLRRWCPIAKTHQDAEDGQCEWEYCTADRPYHLLRLRRMLICSVCQQANFTQKGFSNHECFDVY